MLKGNAERVYEKDISRSRNVLESMVDGKIQMMSKSRYILSESRVQRTDTVSTVVPNFNMLK